MSGSSFHQRGEDLAVALMPSLPRPRLVNEIRDPLYRLIKIVAPAGYGKSTVLKEAIADSSSVAVIDAGSLKTAVDFFRALVTFATIAGTDDQVAELSKQIVALGDDESAWERLAASIAHGSTLRRTIAFENAEALSHYPLVAAAIKRLGPALPEYVRLIVCSRVNVLQLGRFAGPDRALIIGAAELRFSEEEIHAIFRELRISKSQLADISSFSQGWPMLVMMLFALARRGRLDAYLRDGNDVADLFAYIAGEVLATLHPQQRAVLEAIAAVPGISLRELEHLFPRRNAARTFLELASQTPFVGETAGILELHPAVRQMLMKTIDADRIRATLFERVDREDGGARAAEIAFLRNRPDDAAHELAERWTQGSWWSPRRSHLHSLLSIDQYVKYPRLWVDAVYVRAAHDILATINEGERIIAELSFDTPPGLRLDILCAVAQMLANRGRLEDAERLIKQFVEHPAFRDDAVAGLCYRFYQFGFASYRGEPLDINRWFTEFAPLSTPVFDVIRDMIGIAPYHRIHGEAVQERAVIERGLEIARTIGEPEHHSLGLTYAIMSAWFWGDDARVAALLDELARAQTPAIQNGFRFLLDCLHGRGLRAQPISEKLDMRTYSYAMAAALETRKAPRLELARASLLAAEQSAQRFCEALACTVMALCEPEQKNGYLERAQRLAREMSSTALEASLSALSRGDPAGTMLEALARRFGHPTVSLAAAPKPRLRFEFSNDGATVDGIAVDLTAREFELLVFLALRESPTPAGVISKSLWPGSPSARARTTLKVTMLRLRNRLGDASIIVWTRRGYVLRAERELDIEQVRKRISDWHWAGSALNERADLK